MPVPGRDRRCRCLDAKIVQEFASAEGYRPLFSRFAALDLNIPSEKAQILEFSTKICAFS